MLGRTGMATALIAASLLLAAATGGCQSKAQRAEAKQRKQAEVAQRDAARQQAAANKRKAAEAKRQAALAQQQAEEQQRQAAIQSKRDAKRMAAIQKEQAKRDRELQKEAEKQAKQDATDREWQLGANVMRDEDEPRLLDRWVKAQAAEGAADDAMLSDAHFDGGELNSLGRSKLALIAAGSPQGQPVVVYVSGNEKLLEARRTATDTFWKGADHPQLTLALRNGRNLDLVTPANVGLRGLQRMEKPLSAGSGATGGGSEMGGTGGLGAGAGVGAGGAAGGASAR